MVTSVFVWSVLTGISFSKVNDPVGKYYGTGLYITALSRFIYSGQVLCDMVTAGILALSVASILSRTIPSLKKADLGKNTQLE
ncbi:MAG: hypothetical protein QFX35_00490 [Candidatus Verstraetearchaeota archaeon]|nr:hypothetical protein [Candidatus Verstraetearchaeota archaeon]